MVEEWFTALSIGLIVGLIVCFYGMGYYAGRLSVLREYKSLLESISKETAQNVNTAVAAAGKYRNAVEKLRLALAVQRDNCPCAEGCTTCDASRKLLIETRAVLNSEPEVPREKSDDRS